MATVTTDDATPPLGVPVARSNRRQVLVEQAVIGAVVIAVLVALVAAGAGVSGIELAASWQLLDRRILEHDLLAGLWYLHTQPPLHNLIVGLVLTSPLPAEGTLFVLYGLCLMALGLLCHDLLRRWDVPGPIACVTACLVVTAPMLLATIHTVGYEVPVALMVVALVWLVDRHMATPSRLLLVAVAAVGTAIVLTRALFHPLWLAVILVIVVLARRLDRRTVLAAVAIPVLAIGAVGAKNAAVVERPTLSTWTGFNMQRGVVAPMLATDVAAAIDDGAVTSLAAQRPWQDLVAYAPWLDGCRPTHTHPALAAPRKVVTGDFEAPNFNQQCYLPLYDESRRNAVTMIRRQPARYASSRLDALAISFSFAPIGSDHPLPSLLGEPGTRRTWMDRAHQPLLLLEHTSTDVGDWNLPLYGDRLRLRISWTLVGLALIVAARTCVAATRIVRPARSRRPWPGGEVVWLVAGSTVLFVILGGDLVELGENGRFRAMVDPLLIVLTVHAVVEAVGEVRARRGAGAV